MSDFRTSTTPEWDAINQFDAANNMMPWQEIARGLCGQMLDPGCHLGVAIDLISDALENAYELGKRRALLEDIAIRSSSGRMLTAEETAADTEAPLMPASPIELKSFEITPARVT